MRDTLDNPLRLAALADLDLLDTAGEEAFDRLTRLAQRLLKTPVTLISLVDDRRQFFKSFTGLKGPVAETRQTPLSHSFCQHVVTSGEPLIVSDARIDPTVQANLAIRDLGVISYLGFPLKSVDGYTLGSFCAIDNQPRTWTTAEMDLMRELTELVISQIALRQAQRREHRDLDKLTKIASQVPGVIYQYRLRPDGTSAFPYASEGIREIYAVTPEEVARDASPVFRVLHPDDMPEVVRTIQESAQTLRPWHCQYRVRHPDGRELWLQGDSVPEREADGSILWHGFITDITRVKRLTEQLRVIGDNIPGTTVFQWEQGSDGVVRILYTSAGISALTGLSAAQVASDAETLFSRFEPEDRACLTATLARSLVHMEAALLEARFTRIDGARRWLKLRATPRRRPGGGALWDGSLTDITARKEDLHQLYRTHRALAILSRCNETLVRARTEEDLLQQVCDSIVAESGYRFAWVGYLLDDDTKSIEPVSVAGVEEGYLKSIKLSWDDSEAGQGPAGTAIRTGHAVICRDSATDPHYRLWRKEAADRGYRSSIGIPLMTEGKAYGLLSIYADISNAFDADEEALLVKLADNLAYGIKAIRAENERQSVQRALRETAERLALSLKVSNLGLWRRNLTSGGWSWEPRALQILGLDPLGTAPAEDDVLARVHPDDRETVTRSWLSGPLDRPAFSLRFRVTHADGQIRHVELHAQVDDPSARPRWGIGVLGDVTDIVRTTSEAVRLRGQLIQSQKMEALGKLAAGVAHDFNNLLTGINGLVELASFSIPDSHEAANLLKEAHAGAMNARVLVRKILDFTRRKDSDARHPTELNALVSDLTPLINAALPRNASLVTRLDPAKLTVTADPSQIQQLIINLCINGANALKGEAGYVSVSTRRSGTHVELSVADTGCGMDPETLSRIFEPFFTTRGDGQGTGLGLSIVNDIVSAHGGTIAVESTVGKGTVFRILLPSEEATGPTDGVRDLPLSRRQRILVIDDDPILLEVLHLTLKRKGFQPEPFLQSAAALDAVRLEPHSYAALITDQSLPEIGGYEVVREVRKLSPNLPVIVMSGSPINTEELSQRNIHSVGKPFDMDAMAALLCEIAPAGAGSNGPPSAPPR